MTTASSTCVMATLGILLFQILDNDKPLILPVTQKTNTLSQTVNSPNIHTSLDHVVIIAMENKSYTDIVGNRDAPYINSLIHQYSLADNYFAVSHPSLPNYIALTGGNTFGITSDCTDCYISAANLMDQLEGVHKTWRAYMESMPNACFSVDAYPYVQKHNPFMYFDDIRNSQNRCKNITPYTQLQSDFHSLSSTPDFAWISPNLCSDMHDCSVATGDSWLGSQVPRILNSPAFAKQKSLLVITWDEGEGEENNRVPTILIGNSVRRGFVSHTVYTHYSLLHTIESIWNLPPITMEASQSSVMSDVLINVNK